MAAVSSLCIAIVKALKEGRKRERTARLESQYRRVMWQRHADWKGSPYLNTRDFDDRE